MGRSWLPEPPIGNHSSELSSPATVFLPDSDNEDQDVIHIEGIGDNAFENDGYQLLADSDNLDQEENDDGSNEENESVLNNETVMTVANAPTNMCDNVTETVGENFDGNSKSNNDPPRDIVVDIEQVQAVMTRITLPTSAIPTWAVNVPDTEWGSFLQNRIALLQRRSSPLDESKP